MFYICTKFRENISKDFRIIERTRCFTLNQGFCKYLKRSHSYRRMVGANYKLASLRKNCSRSYDTCFFFVFFFTLSDDVLYLYQDT